VTDTKQEKKRNFQSARTSLTFVKVDQEDEEETGAGQRGVPKVKSDAEETLSKRVADYDYLVGMAIWKLSTEDKDRLLEESEAKKTELQTLKRKSWDDLWEEDLAAFLIALDKQEKKELADIEAVLDLASKKLAKNTTAKGKIASKKIAQSMADVKPNPNALRCEPDTTDAITKYGKKRSGSDETGLEKPAAPKRKRVAKGPKEGEPPAKKGKGATKSVTTKGTNGKKSVATAVAEGGEDEPEVPKKGAKGAKSVTTKTVPKAKPAAKAKGKKVVEESSEEDWDSDEIYGKDTDDYSEESASDDDDTD